MQRYDIAIVGAGPGGLACAIKAEELGLSYVLLEKGSRVFQGIIDSYPRGKKVYPTIPKGESDPFPIADLEPSPDNEPVEEYIVKIEACMEKHGIEIRFNEDFQDIVKEKGGFRVVTRQNQYAARNVVLAFGSNIPIDLGVYGEAKTVARKLDNTEEHIGAPTFSPPSATASKPPKTLPAASRKSKTAFSPSSLVQIQLRFTPIAFYSAPEYLVAAFGTNIAGLFILDPFFSTDLAPIRNGPQYNLLAHSHGEIFDIPAWELITLMTSLVTLLPCAGPDLTIFAVHEPVIR